MLDKLSPCVVQEGSLPVAYLGFHFGGRGGGGGWVGGSNYFGRSEVGVFAGGFGGMLPEKIFKMVQFSAFWRIFC